MLLLSAIVYLTVAICLISCYLDSDWDTTCERVLYAAIGATCMYFMA